MANTNTHYYSINLPLEEALEVRDNLESTIWDIAQQNKVDDILRESNFRIKVGEPAIEIGIAITVVVTYLATKVVDKATDKALDKAFDAVGKKMEKVWKEVILPKLRDKLGNDVFIDKEE